VWAATQKLKYRRVSHPSTRGLLSPSAPAPPSSTIGSPPYMLNTRGGRIKYEILFRFSLFYEYSNLEYVHIRVIHRVNQAEDVIRIRVAASQEYVTTYSTCRLAALAEPELPVWITEVAHAPPSPDRDHAASWPYVWCMA